MSPSLRALGIDQLTVEERIALAQEIWESIEPERHRPLLTESQRDELERRVADHQVNPGDVVPWQQIKDDARARYRP